MMFPIHNNPNRNQISLQTNTHIKDKKPPNFDGTSNWQDFLVQFEMVAAVNKWDDNAKAFELATSLRGVAQGVVTEIEPLRRFDYNYLVSSLTSRFEPVNQENMYKVQMNSFYRKQDQTLPEMAQEIKRITRLAYPTVPIDIRNQLRKDCFNRKPLTIVYDSGSNMSHLLWIRNGPITQNKGYVRSQRLKSLMMS
ncbi:unnamed protein product [Mytilus coruscus]|uniref:Uncharacterized protein n=1 Tax=Mytilus coruscus TaxID=42192 RepID=A0A6J8C2S7_MYTCO|nr:unnamed protein product [Mytilus coruscus]